MLLGVTTPATTGEHGTGFAGATNAGTEISAPCESGDEYFHDTSPYLDLCRLWRQRIAPIGWRLQAQRCQRLCCRPVIGITNSGRFRTIQIAPPAGATFFAPTPTPWRGLGFAASTSSLSTGNMAVERSSVRPSSSLAAGGHPHRKHRALARLARHRHIAAHHARELAG